MKTSTRCVQLGRGGDSHGAIVPPIYQTATFEQPSATEFGDFDYTRSGNPTRALLEQQLADLEEAKYACAFASGMAAITALTRIVRPGEEIIAGDDLYGGTVRLLDRLASHQNITVRYLDTTSATSVKEALTARTRLVLIETPSNPLFRISDLVALGEITRATGTLLAVDNSMLSPVFQRPITLGADIVIHSATKFLCGHSDVTAGAVITNEKNIHEQIAFQQNAEGAGLSPFESWLLLRGLKTLSLRVERQNLSATKIAQFLASHPQVTKVFYPGLETHPGYLLHRKQSEGDGAVVSFTTGNPTYSVRVIEAARLFRIAVSFGSVGSTISLPYRMSHASIPAALRDRLAPPEDLIRLSVGIEDVDDLIEDLDAALHNNHKTLHQIANGGTQGRVQS
ncbi:MAG: methionine biosynthesis PLP-dependent protein [Acidobacteria bacterium]|nr:MAG: methionine biosynthesis PLP-dependent protein [Acidobacteriota bacterium]